MLQNNYYQQPMCGQPMQQGMMPNVGMVYNNQPIKQPAFENPLGKQKIEELLKTGRGLPNVAITEEDYDRAICTHRLPDGTFKCHQLPNGKWKCEICGDEFNIIEDATNDDIQKCAENMHDLMSTAKISWVDAPANVLKENFQVQAVLDKIPQIYSIANASLERYNGAYNPGTMYGQPNGFQMLNQVLNGNVGQPMMQQPMMYQQAPQQMMPQQQMMQPQQNPYNYMNPMAQQMVAGAPGMMSNGMGYTQQPQINLNPAQTNMPQQPMMQQQQMQQQMQPAQQQQMQPAQQQQVAQQPAPAPVEGAATVTQKLSV